MLRNIKIQPLTPQKAETLSGLKEGIEQMNLIRGKLKGIPARDLLDEL